MFFQCKKTQQEYICKICSAHKYMYTKHTKISNTMDSSVTTGSCIACDQSALYHVPHKLISHFVDKTLTTEEILLLWGV